MSRPEIDASVEDVRISLSQIDGDVDSGVLPEETIEQAIHDETLVVYGQIGDDWDARLAPRLEGTGYEPVEALELLVRRKAARKAFNTSPTKTRIQALDAVVSFDIQAFRGQLRSNVDEIYELLGIGRDGSSAAFADVSDHAPGGGTEDRWRRAEGRSRRG